MAKIVAVALTTEGATAEPQENTLLHCENASDGTKEIVLLEILSTCFS